MIQGNTEVEEYATSRDSFLESRTVRFFETSRENMKCEIDSPVILYDNNANGIVCIKGRRLSLTRELEEEIRSVDTLTIGAVSYEENQQKVNEETISRVSAGSKPVNVFVAIIIVFCILWLAILMHKVAVK